jgi:hypothetical protein
VIIDVSAGVGANVGSWRSPSFIVGLNDDSAAGALLSTVGEVEGASDADAAVAKVGAGVETIVGDSVGIAVVAPFVGTTVGGAVRAVVVVGSVVGGASMDATNVGKIDGAMESSTKRIAVGAIVGTARSIIVMGADVGNTVVADDGVVVAATGAPVELGAAAGVILGLSITLVPPSTTADGLSLGASEADATIPSPSPITADDGLSLGASDAATPTCIMRADVGVAAATGRQRKRKEHDDRQQGGLRRMEAATSQVNRDAQFGRDALLLDAVFMLVWLVVIELLSVDGDMVVDWII